MSNFESAIEELNLGECGLAIPISDLLNILRGVVAAPSGFDNRWMDLVQKNRPDGLDEALIKAKDIISGMLDPGFVDGLAPKSRVLKLREKLAADQVSAFIIPRTDEYQAEYVAERSDRLAWLTGFGGSAGVAVVGLEKAAIFVDGRYTVQVRQQVDGDIFEYLHLINDPYTKWLQANFSEGDRVAYDPWLHSENSYKSLRLAASKGKFELVPVDQNYIDMIWENQPAAPISPIRPHDMVYAGESSQSKTVRLGDKLSSDGFDATVIASPDCIAWMLNIRGEDVANCPLPLSFSILHKDGQIDWFVDEVKVLEETRQHLGNNVSILPIGEFIHHVKKLGLGGNKVFVDPSVTASAIFAALREGGALISEGEDPVLLPRAIKNAVELDGTRNAHKRDAVAICKFLHCHLTNAGSGSLTELDAVDALQSFRAQDPLYRSNSFDTISGFGPNGAVVHYRVSESTNLTITNDNLLLVDSGGQYPDGTTDITRTIAIGTPSTEMIERFTLVLKGHIALAMARFPAGLPGSRLDTLARAPLWSRGLDFDHGTGHGVGSYLNVHEGPQRIASTGATPLEPGMILSNEPGYYKDGEYGIRIENLVIVNELGMGEDGRRKMYGFETITLAPIDLRLVDAGLLSDDEREWLNSYHARVFDVVAPQLADENVRTWLKSATRPV
ncbi:MAG: aminopeptidase P family protein [Alphaproteobacteria bacterium]|nr:aminopeptidase P family protein [Alphaproteobacteria bacterium]